MNIKLLIFAAIFPVIAGCASQRISGEDPVNRALKICGLGIDAKSADAYKAVFDGIKGTASFVSEASEAVDTQVGILIKQADMKSDPGVRMAAEEMKATRECVVRQVDLTRPASKSELLEQCRLDVQRKISPPGNMQYGVLRNWNQASGKLSDSDVVIMAGYFDAGGDRSFNLRAKCDVSGGKFNESAVERQ